MNTKGLHPALAILIFLVLVAIYVLALVGFVQNIEAILNGDHSFWTILWTTVIGLALISASTNRNSSK